MYSCTSTSELCKMSMKEQKQRHIMHRFIFDNLILIPMKVMGEQWSVL